MYSCARAFSQLIDAESESDKVKVKDALRVVAEARNSPALQRVLQTNTGSEPDGRLQPILEQLTYPRTLQTRMRDGKPASLPIRGYPSG